MIQKIYKCIRLKNGEFKGHQVSTNYMSNSLHLNNRLPIIGQS